VQSPFQRDFPLPVATIGAGRVWDKDTVLQWMRETGRLK
jgi:hypothetical protein